MNPLKVVRAVAHLPLAIATVACRAAVNTLPDGARQDFERLAVESFNSGFALLSTNVRAVLINETPKHKKADSGSQMSVPKRPQMSVPERPQMSVPERPRTDLNPSTGPPKSNTTRQRGSSESVAFLRTVSLNLLDGGEQITQPDSSTRQLKKWYRIPTEKPEMIFKMLTEFQLYPQWLPWCTASRIVSKDAAGVPSAVEISFGINAGPFGTIDDVINYQVQWSSPAEGSECWKVIATNEGSTFCSRLVYDWTLTTIPREELSAEERSEGMFTVEVDGEDASGGEHGEGKHAREWVGVELNMEFVAKQQWYVVVFDSLKRQVIDGMAGAFRDRLVLLHEAHAREEAAADRGHDVDQSVGKAVSTILSGPFRDASVAVLITEGDGRSIRHANAGFYALTGYTAADVADGIGVGDLLQGEHTSGPVASALGRAVEQRLPASARLMNYRKDSSAFLNFLRFEPVLDDERGTGMVYWAVLQDWGEEGAEGQRLLPQRTSEHAVPYGTWTTQD